MPLPRPPRPKRRCGGSRSARRRSHEKAWLTEKLMARFMRFAELLDEKRRQDIATGAYQPSLDHSAQEKAPGLAAEGFSSCFRETER